MTYEVILETEQLNVIQNNELLEVIDSSETIEINTISETIEFTDTIIPVKGDKGDPFESTVFEYLTPADTWTINHNKNYYPTVIFMDSFKKKGKVEVEYYDKNTVIVRFAFPQTGSVIIN